MLIRGDFFRGIFDNMICPKTEREEYFVYAAARVMQCYKNPEKLSQKNFNNIARITLYYLEKGGIISLN